jgi:hypothetical protein
MKFYSVELKRNIEVPKSKVRYARKKGRKFAHANVRSHGKNVNVWRAVK